MLGKDSSAAAAREPYRVVDSQRDYQMRGDDDGSSGSFIDDIKLACFYSTFNIKSTYIIRIYLRGSFSARLAARLDVGELRGISSCGCGDWFVGVGAQAAGAGAQCAYVPPFKVYGLPLRFTPKLKLCKAYNSPHPQPHHKKTPRASVPCRSSRATGAHARTQQEPQHAPLALPHVERQSRRPFNAARPRANKVGGAAS